MAKRSHNETFILLRNNAQKNRSFYSDFNKDDERVKLVGANNCEDDVFDLEILNYSSKNGNRIHISDEYSDYEISPPSWLSQLDEFRYDAFNIKEKIEQLKRTQSEHIKQQNTAIFADEAVNKRMEEYEFDIERRCRELNVLFNRLHSILMHFRSLSGSKTINNRLISTILRNIFQFQVHEIVNLTHLFRSCQRLYVERRNEATRIDPEFVITFDEELFRNEPILLDNNNDNNGGNRHYGDSSFFENDNQYDQNRCEQDISSHSFVKQQQIDLGLNVQLRERQNEMNTIMRSFSELNQLFQEVNTLVVDQGSALDRIDFNLEQVQHSVELGSVSLEKAHRSITRMRKLKLILGAGFFLFIILLLIILRS
ncbi:hypothetical protein RDWZM_009666 [Blomia tropicalis]|uniref:t-SNARE coiled-coil homology domain-containing protein n=1 Tax=Blomia tropicalis TaxID=40697 RepID=A0A9Q0M446_BLOTA|nr:hypothetical protein RDWZM_009666 [Blomia tropicalis]